MAARGVKLEVRGIAELRQRLAFLKEQGTLDAIAYRATIGAAKDVRKGAVDIAESKGLHDSGALVRNIAIKRIREGATKRGYTVGVRHGGKRQIARTKAGTKDDPFYWWFLEFGTIKMAARPFLRPAWGMFQARGTKTVIDQALYQVNKAADAALRRFVSKGGKGR